MSLKTDYLNGPNGYTEQMLDVFDQGVAWVVSNTASISTELQAAAAKGLRSFTVKLPVAFEPANLRLLGNHWKSFQAGVVKGLSDQEVLSYECSVELNTEDSMTTYIDLEFTF